MTATEIARMLDLEVADVLAWARYLGFEDVQLSTEFSVEEAVDIRRSLRKRIFSAARRTPQSAAVAPAARIQVRSDPAADAALEAVIKRHMDRLMRLRFVEGVAAALDELTGEPVIQLLTTRSIRRLTNIPSTIEGYPVMLECAGVIRAAGRRASPSRRGSTSPKRRTRSL